MAAAASQHTKRRWRQRAGTLSVAERSYPTSEVRGSSLECQAATAQEWPRGATLRPRSGAAAERSYPASEVSGGWEELPRIRGQGHWPVGNTPCPRSVVVAERSYSTSEVSGGREETPRVRGQGGGREELPLVRGQWWPGGDTVRPRSWAAAKSHLVPEARGSDPEEPPPA